MKPLPSQSMSYKHTPADHNTPVTYGGGYAIRGHEIALYPLGKLVAAPAALCAGCTHSPSGR